MLGSTDRPNSCYTRQHAARIITEQHREESEITSKYNNPSEWQKTRIRTTKEN